MTEFEYISVLLSIIIGLAVTQLLSGIARLVRDGRSLAPAWWIMAIVATLLLGSLQVWWTSFGWRRLENWTFFSYATFMVLPALLYLLSYLALPADLHLDGRTLVREFIARRKPFYVLLGMIPFASYFQQWMLVGEVPLNDTDTLLRMAWFVFAVPGFLSSRVAVQAFVASAALVHMLIYISLLFVRLH